MWQQRNIIKDAITSSPFEHKFTKISFPTEVWPQ